jgi:biotin carboxyl carrier protein
LINETTSVWLEKSGRELGGAKRVNEHSIYKALLPGRVVASAIQPGSLVHQGETLFVVEAMKMHHEIKADRDARVGEIYVQVNDFVQQNQSMFKWELDDVEA